MSTNLKPDIVWIEGRCYRMNESSTTIAAYQEHDMYENGMLIYTTILA